MASALKIHPRLKKFDPPVIMGTALLFILALEILGTGFYMYFEGWRFIDALYFTTTTLTTIGFGDHVPSHDISKLFTIFFAFAGVGTVLFCVSLISEHYFRGKVAQMQRLEDKIHHALLPKAVKEQEEKVKLEAQKLEQEKKALIKEEVAIKKEEKEIVQERAKIKQVAQKI